MKGKILRKALKDMPLERKLNLIKKIAVSLHKAHKLGILHRYINPSNIMAEKDEIRLQIKSQGL